ncbi:6-phosphogluconolactonase [Candidatus Woesearchaeota archaeon]|nr:6-phosphogluconolactonase [Candidatus Woesearchaeota archaeon]|tara:strand:+ start:3811 stop:4452 length:642 start_codon:yes stop_codon:yes gene_type:complete
MTKTIFKKSIEELSKAAVDIIVDAIAKLLQEKEQVILAIPGGRSVVGIWNLLAEEQRIDWSKVHVFMADERVVAPTHKDSNYKLAHDIFLSKVSIPKENLHPFFPGKEYKFENPDIIILSSGEDGHVGALYPNHHSVKNESEGYIEMDDSPKPPLHRITMSKKTMLTAKTALLLFVGEGKREAYEKFKSGDEIVECPARLVKKIKDSYVLTDL